MLARAQKIAAEFQANRPVKLPEDIRKLTGFKPRPLQQHMFDTMRRFNSWVVHRRFGKSVLAVNTLIERAIECPFQEGRYAYAGPTYDQTEDIVWTYLDEFTKEIPGRKVEKANLAVWLPTRRGGRSRIRLYGVDNPKQRIRGMYLDGVVLDEWAQIPPHVWTQQIRPMLSDDVRQGYDDHMNPNQWAIFIFTPFGRNHAYRMHKRADLWFRGLGAAQENDNGETTSDKMVFRTDWSAHLYPASKTGVLSAQELADIRADMDSDEAYEQEMECSFDAAVKGSIFGQQIAEAKAAGRITHVAYNPMLPVHTGWDLGHDDATAIWFCQLVGMEIRIIDYYEASGAGLDHYADVLEKRGYRYGRHYLPHDVEVVELGTNKSRKSVLRSYGVRSVTVPRHNPEDGIAAVRAILPRCWFDEPRTGEGLDRLALYRRDWDDRQQTFRQKPKHDWTSHGADAFRTLVMGLKREPPGAHDDLHSPRAVL